MPSKPDAPTVMLSLTNEQGVAVEWMQVASAQAPGSDIRGYVLEMKDLRADQGNYEVVFDGSDGYPNVINFFTSAVAGNKYLFRVKAKYLNGFSAYSDDSLPVWACSPPSNMQSPSVLQVSRS